MTRKRLIQGINEALHEEMERDDRVIVFGEDVEIGMFGDTRGLAAKFGKQRVRDTPISESLMTGMAVGAAAAGYRPICHLLFGNFIYTGFDAIANQTAKLRYMTGGQTKLPLVIMATMGAGRSSAAQHSDAPYPALMNLGGIKVIVPSTPADAKGLLKSAIRDNNPVVFLQPARRGGEQSDIPDGEHLVPIGLADIKRSGTDITLVAIGSMMRPALRAAAAVADAGISVEVIDPRTLYPLDHQTLLTSVRKTGRLIIVDEARRTCGAASEIAAIVAEEAFSSLKAGIRRLTVNDLALPFSPPLEEAVLPSEQLICENLRAIASLGVRN